MTNQSNCELIADILVLAAKWARHPVYKWVFPQRKQADKLEMLAATFSRVRGIPETLPDQFDAKLLIAMGEPRLD